MKEKREQPAPDAELFRQALEGVTPLAPSNRIATAAPKPAPRVSRRDTSPPHVADRLSDHGAGEAPLAEFARNGVSRMTLRKLKRGHYPLQDSLDLHGLTTESARRLLQEFLRAATEHRLRCVSVIHGKGRHAEGGEGILKNLARHWLTQCPDVLAFCESPQHMGGDGAVWVLLKVADGDGGPGSPQP